MKKMVKVSVIVPVYNVEMYVNKCIESILAQTFQDFELILVDDGSTDHSREICTEYSEKYKNVMAVYNVHEGVAEARNRGLEEAAGEFITFVDSDDWVDKTYLETLYRLQEAYHADLVISCGINVIDGKKINRRNNNCQRAFSEAEVVSRSEAYRRMLICEQNASVVTWAKLYHKKLFENVRYPKGEIYEDSKVISQIVERSDRIICTPYAGYYYLRRKGSIVHGRIQAGQILGIKNAKSLWSFIRKKYPNIEDAAKVHYLRSCFDLLNLLVVNPIYQRQCRKLRKKIIHEEPFFMLCRYVRLTEKIGAVGLLFGVPFYKWMWRFYLSWTGKISGTVVQ